MHSIVQHEGWLLKRGEGYVPDSSANNAFSVASSTSSFSAEGDNDGSATVSSPSQKFNSLSPSIKMAAVSVASAAKNALFNLGKDEKRRYFMLVTTASFTTPMPGGTIKKEPPKAVLKYYSKGKPSSLETVKPKGEVILAADTKIELNGIVLVIKTQQRTYYVRPDVSESNSGSAHAKTSVSQWKNAIDFAIQGLKTYEISNSYQNHLGHHPMHDRRSLRGFTLGTMTSPSNLNFERKRIDGRAISGPGKAMSPRASSRTNVEHEATGAFAELWATNGIDAYNDLVGYFGPVQIDIQRLREHYASRIRQIRNDHLVLEEANSRSNEFVAKEQRTMRHAVGAMNLSLLLQKKHLMDFPARYEMEILKPLDDLGIAVKVRLETIVSSHSVAVSDIQTKKNELENIVDEIHEINKQLKIRASQENETSEPDVNNQEKEQKRRASAFFRGKNKAEETPEMLEERLNNLRQGRRDGEAALIESESKNSAALIDAMNQLEILEFQRMQKLKEIMEHAGKLEIEFVDGLIEATTVGYPTSRASEVSNISSQTESSQPAGPPPESPNKLIETIALIDPPKDIKATFYMLKSKAESTRPTGRPRRANSLVRNSQFLEMLGELNLLENNNSASTPKIGSAPSPTHGKQLSMQEQKIS